MKLFIFLLLCLFFISGPKYYVEGFCYKKHLPTECIICDQTSCRCTELILEECNKISLKKLILLFLEKTSLQCGHAKGCEECFHCQHNCPKTHWVTKVLTDILRQASHSKNEEQCIRNIILKVLNPSTCKECPCQDYCDPVVQKVLKAILRRATNCGCAEFPCECMLDSTPCGVEHSKYWFTTTKEELRKEMTYKPQSKPPSCCKKFKCCQKKKCNEDNKYLEYPVRDELGNMNRCEKHKTDSKCKTKTSKSCKSCRKPNELICSRYFNKDREHLFSICAEAKQCRIKPSNIKGNVALSCTGCKPINSPFVQFTKNGYPFKETNEGQNEIQIRTKFLQINDLKQTSKSQEKEVFNPFISKCNFPRKKKSKCKKL